MRGYSLTRTPRHSLCRTPLRTGTPGEERGNKGSPTEANACCVSTPGRTLRLLVSLPLGDSQRQPSGLRWHTLCPVADRPYFRWGGRNIPSESMALGSHQAKVETVAFWGEPCSVTVAQITWVLRLLAAQAAKCFKVTAFQSGDAWSTLRAEGGLAGWAAAHPGSAVAASGTVAVGLCTGKTLPATHGSRPSAAHTLRRKSRTDTSDTGLVFGTRKKLSGANDKRKQFNKNMGKRCE